MLDTVIAQRMDSVLLVHVVTFYLAECSGGCQNGGTCSLPEVCTCAPGWTGMNCETGWLTTINNSTHGYRRVSPS